MTFAEERTEKAVTTVAVTRTPYIMICYSNN